MFVLQAELANRDFTAERGQVIVISNGAVASKDRVRDQQERLLIDVFNDKATDAMRQSDGSIAK